MLANTSKEIVLKIPCLAFGNVDVEFTELKRLNWKSYTLAEVLPTTSWVELINKREFAKAALDKNYEIFVVHIAALETEVSIYPSPIAQIATL